MARLRALTASPRLSTRRNSFLIDALMRVQLDACVPVFSMVLTPHHFHEHETHRDFFMAHMRSKGREAAEAVVGTLEGHRLLLPTV